ncbi:MAG: Gfo/Idh/MocA family oxidoreductase [Defluviitaleaceae bacterium]|nr:Gfo/Idh/MocA family oxidoreductase [Defluviitaleaceae bacterium]
MKKLKCAIIGAGNISGKHLHGYKSQSDRVELAAVCDIIPERAEAKAKEFGIPDVYTDYGMIAKRKDIDFVCICLPNYLHCPATVQFLNAGKHVHCEKPMALNGKQANEMLAVSRATGKKLMVGVNNRFTNQAAFVKGYINDGKLGKVYYSRCGWIRRGGLSYAGWFCDKKLAGGGPMIDLGVHFIDLTLYYLGYPEFDSISARTFAKFGTDDNVRQLYTFDGAKADFNQKYTVEDFIAGFVNFKDDSCMSFEVSWASNIEKEKTFYEILGDKGGLRYDSGAAAPLKIYSVEQGQFVDIEPKIKSDAYGISEFGHFADCILADKEPTIAPPEQTAKMMELIDAAYKSAEKNGRQVVFK